MSYELDPIYQRFQQVAASFIGDDLAKGSNNVPMIYRETNPNSAANYPFAIVSITDAGYQNITNAEYFNEEGGFVTEVLYNMLVTYSVYATGDTSHRANQLALDLSSKFSRMDVQQLFAVDNLGAVVRVDPISHNTFKRDDQVGEAASFNILFSVKSEEINDEDAISRITADIEQRLCGSEDTFNIIDIDTDNGET